MNDFGLKFYDLLSRAFGGENTSARLQGFVDDMFQKYNTLQLPGFTFNPDMQLDFTYEQVEKDLGINVMANYYDIDSPAIPNGSDGLGIVTGKIPRMKQVEYFDEDKQRKQLIVEKMYGSDSERAEVSAQEKLFVTIDKLVGGHTNSLTYQRHQMVSNGALTLNDANNPKGIKGVTFSASVPSDNKTHLTGNNRFWTDKGTYATEGSSADPLGAIEGWLEPILDKGVAGHLEVNSSYLKKILKHSKVLEQIGLSLFPGSTAENAASAAAVQPQSTRKTVIEGILGVSITPIDSLCAVEKYDKTAKKLVNTSLQAFNSDVIVFVPDGNIGEVITVLPLLFESANASYADFYGGRLKLTVDADAVHKCQAYQTEMTCLAVPTAPKLLYYLFPND